MVEGEGLNHEGNRVLVEEDGRWEVKGGREEFYIIISGGFLDGGRLEGLRDESGS